MPEKTTHNFHNSKKIGDKGENKVTTHLQKTGAYQHIINIANHPDYYKYGADLLGLNHSLETTPIDIKTDTYTHNNNNLFIETTSNNEKNNPGWIKYTVATRIYYVASPTNTCYVLNTKHKKELMLRAILKGSKKEVWNYGYTSTGYAVNLEHLPSHLYQKIKLSS